MNVAEQYKALYPDELVSRYAAGERDFRRINLLRSELEQIADQRARAPDPPPPLSERLNPLCCDFLNRVDPEFEWDAFGHFIPTEQGNLAPRDLRGVDLEEASLDGSYLYPVVFRDADLRHVSLRNAILLDVDLRGADLSYADLRWATVKGDLRRAKLYMAKLQRATLAGCDLRGADLGRAKLRRTNLVGANLQKADLRKAQFDKTNLN